MIVVSLRVRVAKRSPTEFRRAPYAQSVRSNGWEEPPVLICHNKIIRQDVLGLCYSLEKFAEGFALNMRVSTQKGQ